MDNNINQDKKPETKENQAEKISVKEVFSNKKVRYGTFASVMTMAIVGIVIVINLIVGKLDLKLDLTADKMYDLSEQTEQIVKAVDKEVSIYPIYTTGNQITVFMEMLDKYDKLSEHVTVTLKDPNLNPQFLQKYITTTTQKIDEGSIIVECGERYRILTQYDLFEYTIDYETYTQTATGISLEPKVTSAIQYVTSGKTYPAYVVEGHGETELDVSVQEALSNDNYEVKALNLAAENGIPSDTNLIIITSPVRDYTQTESEILANYLTNGGNALFILDFADVALPNYESVLAAYGVKPQNKVVIEGDSSRIQQNNPFYILPSMATHDITSPISASKMNVLVPLTQAIELLEHKDVNTKITPLLTTSKSSYAKANSQSTVMEKEDGDINGPLNLAVLIEDFWFTDATEYNTKIVVVSASTLLSADSYSSGANMDFFMNCVNYLTDRTDSISIRSKSLMVEYLSINTMQMLSLALISIVVIPVILLVAGIVVFVRRRNR